MVIGAVGLAAGSPGGSALRGAGGTGLRGAAASSKGAGGLGKAAKAVEEGCNSFLGDTPVLMADGTTRRIDELKIGDQVFASDPEAGESGARDVVATIVKKGVKHLVEIETADGKVVATAQHPFWLPDQQRWADANELRVGSLLQTAAGAPVQVIAIRKTIEIKRVHNLTIDDIHTYYVMAGNTPVLVHNTGGCWRADFDGLPKGNQGHVRTASNAEELRGMFERWTNGAQPLAARGPKIPDVYKLEDGTVIQWRVGSRSGGETIDIFPPSGKPQKVHIE